MLAVGLLVSGCGDGSGGRDSGSAQGREDGGPAIDVDRATARADQRVRITLTGLRAGARVTLQAEAEDRGGEPWRAAGEFTARRDGTVDLERQAPRGGRPYPKADSMGLLSAMLPHGGGEAAAKVGSGKTFSFRPKAPGDARSYPVRLTVRRGGATGKRLAERTLTREWLPRGAGHRSLTVAEDGVHGDLYTPPKGSPKRAPVLVFGGSEGGGAGTYAAAQLAAHGHPALALCYFRCGEGSGRPEALNRIDLDYFGRAARLVGSQPAADAERLAVMGNSRGSEVAQLLGQRRPELVRDVVVYAPSAKVIGPYPVGTAAWTDDGKPVPRGPIPLDRVRGEVLAIGGGDDRMWDSAGSTREIAARAGSDTAPRGLVYPRAGHHVNWFPYGQPGQEGGQRGSVGAVSAADQAARADSWPRVRGLLAR
ncbi:hypothetical protein E0L36_25935 [Streptomyces sp. AJS327]|nr:hypothetical protein [Streptomyces sp. AJS327]